MTSARQIICYGCAESGHIVAYCPKAAVVDTNDDTGDLAAVVCDGKGPQKVSGAQSVSGLVFCVGCSEAEHIVGCPVAAVVDISCGEEDRVAVAISNDEGLQESGVRPEDMVDEQLDLAAVAKSSQLTSEASYGDQMLFGEDISSGPSQKQQEDVPDGSDSCLHVNDGGADQVDSQLSKAEVAVVVLQAVETVPEPVSAEVPVKKLVVPAKFQYRSSQENSQHQSAVAVDSPQLGAGCPAQPHTDKMTQPRDVTDLPQEDATCLAPPTADIDIYGQELMRTIEAMNRDMEWLREGSDMGAWGLPPGNMAEEEDCLGFF